MVVPGEYTHVTVEKPVGKSVLPRWRLGFGGSGELPALTATAAGKRPGVLRYTGDGTSLTLEAGGGQVVVRHYGPGGGGRREIRRASGPFRDTLEVPGPGLIEVDCAVPWSVTVR
ncbi:hypothetical protein JNUCC64_01370 [Streptomyces sp. JNUCC 64]